MLQNSSRYLYFACYFSTYSARHSRLQLLRHQLCTLITFIITYDVLWYKILKAIILFYNAYTKSAIYCCFYIFIMPSRFIIMYVILIPTNKNVLQSNQNHKHVSYIQYWSASNQRKDVYYVEFNIHNENNSTLLRELSMSTRVAIAGVAQVEHSTFHNKLK